MDRIEFVRRPYRDGDRDSGIQIKINGRDLVELVRAVENPFASWPLLCLIDATETRVIWSEFEQPHRRGKGARPPWTYEKLGPFEFDRQQYDEALEALR